MRYRTPAQVKEEFGASLRRALIVTTVPAESRAVQAHLVDIEELVSEKGAYYEYGRFSDPDGDWKVVHAITAQGNSDAGLVASKAHQDFGAFDAVMFVGVAGSLKDDIPIGSVVVGDYVYNSHSAKVEDKRSLSRPHGHAAAPELLAAARALVYSRKWTDLIRPPADMAELPPKNEYPCSYPPEGTIKAIASGEEVVAGGKSRRYVWLRKTFNDAGAVEMEGWGVMNAAHIETTPAIIIRGISDMCAGKDHAKDKLHQPIASVHAAAFAFSVLSFRSRALPATLGEVITEPTAEVAAAQESRVEYVVNFKGSKEEWPEGKIQSIVDRLKELTGDSNLVLVRVESGSIRLVLSVRERDIPHLDLVGLRSAFSQTGSTLLGVTSANQVREAEAAKAALRDASTNLLAWEQTLPGGGWIERPELAEIERRFEQESSSTVLLGDPGSGKSALLSKLATDLIDAGASLFALKSDFISTEVRNEADLQRDLHLPALPSDLILRLARLQPVYVLIDQLDALASQLDLRSDRLNVVLNLVRRVGNVPNVHIVMSARTFEFNHDVRLRAIEAAAVTLGLPAWREVKAKIAEVNIDADMWPEKARDLVRVPQVLKTYLTLAKSGSIEPFTQYQSMLEELWQERIASAGDGEMLAGLASDLAEQMADEEALWLAASKFDSRLKALRRLEALGFIVRSENGLSVAFSHQTVFDYVLARTFIRSAGLLSTYVLERQDSLFVRAKLWSALHYLREAEVGAYEREFLAIWRKEPLRRHLRFLLIEFLGQLAQPRAFEQVCLEKVMSSQDLRILALKAIANSPGWFSTFARTAISDAMLGNDTEASLALRILIGAWKTHAEEVIHLIRERWLPLPQRDTYSWVTIHDCPNWSAEVEVIARTILARTPIAIWQIDNTAQTLVVDQPDVALRLVRAKLDNILKEARKVLPSKPYPTDGTTDERTVWYFEHRPTKSLETILEATEWDGLPAMAEAEPAQFLEILWPWYVDLFAEIIARASRDETAYIYPGQYVIELDLSDTRGREKPVTSSLQLSVEGLAEANPQAFAAWADANSGLEVLAVQQLIARGYELAGEHLASNALTWLLGDHRRFQLGTSRGLRHSTVDLIRAVSPYWSTGELNTFEGRVLGYRPPVPGHLKGPQQKKLFADLVRATKMELLRAVGSERLSPTAQKLVATEKRALGDRFERSISEVEGGWIGSPMEASAMAKAKDRDILKIFAEIPDNTNWDHPTSWMRGGNIQLSRAFADFSRANPERGLRIMEQFEPRRQERAAGYALDAMADDGANDLSLMEALLDLHKRGFETDEFKSSAANSIEKIATRKTVVGEDIVDLLIEWLKRSPVESSAEPGAIEKTAVDEEATSEKEEETLRDGSLLWGLGTSTILPQGNFNILSALASILLNQKEVGRDRFLAILNDHLTREKDPDIWKALLYRLRNAGGSTPQVVSEFLRALFARFPQLLATREAIIFLGHAQRWDDQLVFKLVANWPESRKPLLQRAYGELVGLIATTKSGNPWVDAQTDILRSGTEELKIGLANAAANMWADDKLHEKAGTTLIQLIPGASRRLMTAILDVFRVTDDLVPDGTTVAFLKALTDLHTDLSGAPSNFMVERLQSLLPHEAELVASIASKLVMAWRNELGDIRTATATAAPELTDLALTLHRLGGPSRQAGVAIFETMIELDAYGARDTLAEIDGRFGPRQMTTRRRIARRKTSRSRSMATKEATATS
jgi:nucleoside phosphorylase